MMVWQYLSQGQYNRVYVDRKRRLVLKRAINQDLPYDHPSRSVRLWNILNPNLERPASIHPDGWTCPYIEGRQARDHEIHLHLIAIYQRTGRIVLDACSPQNLIYSHRYQRVICIDIGMAVLMEGSRSFSARRYSEVSNAIWASLGTNYIRYFQREQDLFPLTIGTIKALLVLTKYLPHEPVTCLQDREILIRIASYFDLQPLSLVEVQELKTLIPINLPRIIHHLQHELALLLGKYGQFDERGRFNPSCYGRFFSNQTFMQGMSRLIRELPDAQDPHQLQAMLTHHLTSLSFKRVCCFKNPFQVCLIKFIRLIDESPLFAPHPIFISDKK